MPTSPSTKNTINIPIHNFHINPITVHIDATGSVVRKTRDTSKHVIHYAPVMNIPEARGIELSQPPLLSLCARRECVTIDEVSLPPSPLPPQFPASCIELVRSARVLTRYLYLRPRCHLSSQPPLLSLCARRECVTIDEVSLPPSPLPPQFPASSTELVRSARVLTRYLYLRPRCHLSSQPPLLSLCARRECVTKSLYPTQSQWNCYPHLRNDHLRSHNRKYALMTCSH
ncbi:hypothetical protein M8J75_015900 [Diaphorina citri]|nr:hypothetical protein M8J75_015900 [Diaphorina citri]